MDLFNPYLITDSNLLCFTNILKSQRKSFNSYKVMKFSEKKDILKPYLIISAIVYTDLK